MRATLRQHLILIILTAIIPNLAYCYVDPGSGHLALQLLFAFAAGVLFYLRNIIDWLVPGNKNKPTDPTSNDDERMTMTTEMVRETFATAKAQHRANKQPSRAPESKKKTSVRKTAAKKRA